jgi:hypothetical protein
MMDRIEFDKKLKKVEEYWCLKRNQN